MDNYRYKSEKFNVGEMRELIALYVRVKAKDDLRPLVSLYKDKIYAKAMRLMAREAVLLAATENIIQVNFIIRYRKDITEDMYIKHNESFYRIIGFERMRHYPNFLLVTTTLDEGVSENGIQAKHEK